MREKMHLKCVSLTIVHNLVHFLLIFSLTFQTSLSQQKENIENIPEFENFPIIDSDLERSEEDVKQSDGWIQQTSRSRFTVTGNVANFGEVLPKLSSADEMVNHVINSGVIENLETEELEKISKKYNDFNENNDNNDNESNDNRNENQEIRSEESRHRLAKSKALLRHLLELYKLKSIGILAKRGEGPQLSIVNPLDVLRQRLLLELARRRMKENQDQIQANAEILRKIGKRSINITTFGTIPLNNVHQSVQEFTSNDKSYRLLNPNTNKSCIYCLKNRRKLGANRLFLDKLRKSVKNE